MDGSDKDAARGRAEHQPVPYWQRPSTRKESSRHRSVALVEAKVTAVPAVSLRPSAEEEFKVEGTRGVRAEPTVEEEHREQAQQLEEFRHTSPARSVTKPASMDLGSYVSSTKIDRFCGRPGTVTLREFKACFYSLMDEWEMKLQQHYNVRYSFKMLTRYLTEEAQILYFDHRPALLRDLDVPNPAYAAAIAQATQTALQAAIRMHIDGGAEGPAPTMVVLTAEQLAAATLGISPTHLVPAEPDPVAAFFTILEREYPTKSTEKIRELRNIMRLKGETLKMLYRRVLRLVQETGSATPQGAAQKFLRALQTDQALYNKVKDRVFHDRGDEYTCEDVYLAAERYEMATAHYDAYEEEASSRHLKREMSPNKGKGNGRTSGGMAKGQYNSKTVNSAVASGSGTQAFGCNYCASTDHAAPQCTCPPTSLHCAHCDRDGHVESVCFNKHPERRNLRVPKVVGSSDSGKSKAATTTPADRNAGKQVKKPAPKPKQAHEANQAEVSKEADLTAEIEALKAQVKTLTVSMAARAAATTQASSSGASVQRYGLPYDALMAEDGEGTSNRAARWKEYRDQLQTEEADRANINFHERPYARNVGSPNRAVVRHVLSAVLPNLDAESQMEVGVATRRHGVHGSASDQADMVRSGPVTRARGARAAIPMSFRQLTQEQESELEEIQPSNGSTPPGLRLAHNLSLPATSEDSSSEQSISPEDSRVPPFSTHQELGSSNSRRRSSPRYGTFSEQMQGAAKGVQEVLSAMSPSSFLDRVMNAQLFTPQELGMLPSQVVEVLTLGLQESNWSTVESPEGTPPLVPIRRGAAQAVLPVQTVQMMKGLGAVPHYSVTTLLGQQKDVNSTLLHQVAKGLPLVPLSERMTVNLGAVLVDNRQAAVLINGMAPRIALLDTGAQPVIIGADFARKLGLSGPALQDSAWRIRTAGGQVEKVQGETTQFLRIEFNPGTAQAMELNLRCLVTAATSYDVLMGQEALFPPGVTIDNWTEQAYYRVDWTEAGRKMGFLPLDLHGMQTGSAALTALKVACTASVLQAQVPDEIEEELASDFHDALPSFSSDTITEYAPETIQLLRTCKVSVQEALQKLESVVTTEPPTVAVHPIRHATIQWQPPSEGITLVELFGGMAAGLEAVLKAGMKVKRYVYCDTSANSRLVAESRMVEFQHLYPQQFSTTAGQGAFTTFPADVTLIQQQHFSMLGSIHLLVAGWECQGFSQAGTGKALDDVRSGLFADLVRLIGWAQQQNPNVGYILENTPAQFDPRAAVKQDFAAVQHLVGAPLLVDAVQCGSLAHRLRNIWTNLAPPQVLQLALHYTVRDPTLTVAQILDADTICKPVLRTERPPWAPVNKPGCPRAAWPTLVSYPGSHAFRHEGTGMVQRHESGIWEPPSSEERERAMGFKAGTTAHRKLNQPQRNAILGKAMDLNALSWFVSTCLVFQMLRGITFSTRPAYHSTTWHPDFVYLPCGGRYSFRPVAGGGECPGFHFPDVSLSPSSRYMPIQAGSLQVCTAEAQQAVHQGFAHPSKSQTDAAGFNWTMGPHLRPAEKVRLQQLLDRHRDCFAFSMQELGRCSTMKFKLNLTDDTPIFKRRHRLSRYEWELVDTRCKELQDAGLIRPSSSSYAAATVLPAKKDSEGLWTEKRMCGDYRPLNQVTPQDRYPMPTPEEIFVLKKDVQWLWDADCQTAFEGLQQSLTENPLLRRPDFSKPFIVHTDWSGLGIGAVLSQQDEGCEEHVVAYASRSNNRAESNYSSYEGECLAVVWAVSHFRPYLYGRRFTLFTDHQPLRWLMTNDKLSGKLARWALILQEYEFDVIHRPGCTHQNADTLSRSPDPSTVDLTDARMDHDEAGSQFVTGPAFLSMLVNTVQDAPAAKQDIWQDVETMQYLQTGVFSEGSSATQRDRVQQRSKRYVWRQDHLVRILPTGERVVPPIQDRAGLIHQVHADLGHFGVKRTYSLLAPHYHWLGMYRQVREAVARCSQCDRVKSSFNDRSSQLHPLPIQGLFYRWSCDLAGELPKTPRGNVYVMVMIEHFSKWIELVALPDKSSRSTSQAFLQQVLSRFGACAECLTDQGTEFRGEFQDLLHHALVDHRRTSRDHPQADGLAERMVQTVKQGLRKFCLQNNKHDWDLALPYLAMGYRMSKHASLGEFSPYFLLFGRHPLAPSSIARHMEEVVDLDSPATWAKIVSDRAALFKRAMPMAMQNLQVAQHRDTLRYAHTRGGSYRPKPRKFEVGDFVYMQQQVTDTLGTSTSRVILRVHAIKPSGVLVLQGKDGRTISQHPKHCAPCHLPNLDTTLVTADWIPPVDHPCQVCRRIDDADQMLLCDNCNQGFHLFCLQPELVDVPDSLWFCPPCATRLNSSSSLPATLVSKLGGV